MAVWMIVAAVLAVAVPAGGMEPKDVVGIDAAPAALQVIEEKCLECHNRQRIEESAKQRERIEHVLQRMEQKGAVLTDREHEVIGHFWQQSPFKSKK